MDCDSLARSEYKPLFSGGAANLHNASLRGKARSNDRDRMFSVPIESRSPFTPGKPKLLFEGRYDTFLGSINYDISPDGQRFLMTREYVPSRLHIVLNWFEELKRLVPSEEGAP